MFNTHAFGRAIHHEAGDGTHCFTLCVSVCMCVCVCVCDPYMWMLRLRVSHQP